MQIVTQSTLTQTEKQAMMATLGLSTAEGTATATTVTLSGTLRGLWSTLLANPLILVATAVTAGVMAFSKLNEIAEETGGTFGGAKANAEKSAEAYQNTTSELESLNSELQTTQDRIAELKAQDSLTLVEEAELANLEKENALLQTQLETKEQLANIRAQKLAEDTKKAVDFKSEEVSATDSNGNPLMDRNGNYRMQKVDRKEYVRQQIAEMEKEQALIDEAQKKLANKNLSDKDREIYEKQFEQSTENLKSYKDEVSTIIADLNEEASGFYDANGKVIEGFEDDVKAIEEVTNLVNDFDLSPAEKKLAKIESYFDGSNEKNSIRERLLEIAKSEDDTETVSDALKKMGINLEEAGLDAESLDRYFKEMADSANEAADATEKVNNNLTIDDIASAFESENAGDDYVSLNDYIKQAKELYDQGLTGTDDFKTVAEMMSYNIDSSTASFKENYDKLKNYFKEDSDGNLTAQGVHNFLVDLQNLGEGYATFNKESKKWELNMDNTAQAAKDMGMGVGVFEAMLGRIKDYDNVGDFEFTSAVKEFEEAKSSLEGLQSILDNMEDGERKTALEEKLAQWSPMIEAAEDDLASLPDEVVTKLKFEYDKETLRQMVEQYDKQWESGNRSAEVGANRIIAKEDYRERVEEETGYNENTDRAYAESYAKIEELESKFDVAESDEARQAIQEQISAVLELQNAFQDAFSEGEAVDWESFLQSDKAKELMKSSAADLENILGVPQHIKMDIGVGLTKSKVEKELKDLEEGSTIEFTADLDGIERQVTALKEEDGTITYTAEVNGESVEVLLNQDGSVSYKVVSQEEPTPQTTDLTYEKTKQEPPSAAKAGVFYNKTGQENPDDKTANLTYKISTIVSNAKNLITGGGNSLAGISVSCTSFCLVKYLVKN